MTPEPFVSAWSSPLTISPISVPPITSLDFPHGERETWVKQPQVRDLLLAIEPDARWEKREARRCPLCRKWLLGSGYFCGKQRDWQQAVGYGEDSMNEAQQPILCRLPRTPDMGRRVSRHVFQEPGAIAGGK